MNFVYNYVLVSAVTAWALAQIIKTVTHIIKYKTFNPERLIGAGGMPSSHSSLVCSALIAISRKMGMGSGEFAIMFILAAIVMYDAMGVRRAAGLHAIEINKMNKFFDELQSDIHDSPESIEEPNNVSDLNKKLVNTHKALKEKLGHTPLEVLGGALLGILVALVMPIK